PWGEEAFAAARARHCPIFLSIGYAACHWCHVMERESFENEQIAAYLNEHFVSIKVDREERPDLDDIYMQAVQQMTGGGGWPMTVFLTTDGKPFFGDTYFPPTARMGRIGFLDLLKQIRRAWDEEPARVREAANQLTDLLGPDVLAADAQMLTREPIERAVESLQRRFDAGRGGFGGAPKFPPSMALDLLLREARRRDDPSLTQMVELTLRRMARGGLYDQLGGGFHRYATDADWLVPHFEKMLYDQALLVPVYFDAWRLTGDPFHERIGRETLDYVIADLTHPDGGFYSSRDADSEGVEGKYYLWKPEEVLAELGDEQGRLFNAYYGVVEGGNWHEGGGASILHVPVELEDFARRRGHEPHVLRGELDALRRRLLTRRARRVAPGLDDKIITSWNGLMIRAFAQGARATGDARYAAAAARAADFLLTNLRTPDGRLLRTWRNGQARIPAFLDDYANLALGLVELYQATWDLCWLTAADELTARILTDFHDERNPGFFTTDGRDASVIVRAKEFYDGATLSGNSAAVHALLRVGLLLDRPAASEAAVGALRGAMPVMTQMPPAFHFMLCALDFHLAPPREVAILGPAGDDATRALLEPLGRRYLPHAIAAWADSPDAPAARAVALLRDKTLLDHRPTAYVCRGYVCRQPVHDPAAMLEEINRD
ncbi:MAG TPA: thioredoxin domain-containing protein, partial [Candidatus Sumerlaeota bacterium]|nr:thioredoxin domain-containing protein [Candidatus Sumerlaeota bacterium]